MVPLPHRRAGLAVALALTLLRLASPAAAQGTAALELLVREAGTARPLRDATVRIATTGQFALTDPTGHGMLLQVPVGHHTVEVRHPGHSPQTVELEFAEGMVTQLQVALHVQPIELEGLEVTAKARVARLDRAGFYHRQKVYWGGFLDPEDLTDARARGTPLSNLMRGRIGIAVALGAGGGYMLVSSRSAGSKPCQVAIFIDGVRQYAVDNIDRLISMMDVEAIEIYGGRLSTPIQFQAGGYCGAVVIWTPSGR